MIDIFLHKSSSVIIKEYLNSLQGNEKRGAHQALANALGIFPSYLSLILRGDRDLNLDQGILLADYLKLKKIERRYLLRVIELGRAQSKRLKEEIEIELSEITSKEHQISSKIERNQTSLTLEESSKFFASWKYSATHLIAALFPNITPQLIAKKLKIDLPESKKISLFLFKTGLWRQKNKKVEIGPTYIHIDHQSSFLNQHHRNWRIKAIDRHEAMEKDQELAYSLCVALSAKDALIVRSKLLKTIEEVRTISDPSDSETLYNFNIDWLKVISND